MHENFRLQRTSEYWQIPHADLTGDCRFIGKWRSKPHDIDFLCLLVPFRGQSIKKTPALWAVQLVFE